MPLNRPGVLPGVALLAALPGGCAGPGEPAAQLGSGELEWEAVDDDELEIIQGPQGGFHLLGSVRVAGIEAGDAEDLENPNNPTTRFDVEHDGASILLTGEFTQGLERTPLGTETWTHEVIGRFAILDIEDDDELHGERVNFSVEVTDVHGVTVSDALDVGLVRHPLNP